MSTTTTLHSSTAAASPTPSAAAKSTGQPTPHPLASLQAHEMAIISKATKANYPDKVVAFRRVLLVEPPKALVIPYLEAELMGATLPKPPPRIGQALFYFQGEPEFLEAIVNIDTNKLVSQRVLEGMHGPGDDGEVMDVIKTSLESPLVQAELERLQLPEGSEPIAEPWAYGTDDTVQTRRLYQVWFFLNQKKDVSHGGMNFYATCLDFSAVVDVCDMKVIRIDRMPTTTDLLASKDPNTKWQPVPSAEYAPDLIPGGVRKTLKPLHVIQPEGVSFKVGTDGESYSWEKWTFRAHFDVREGIVFRNIVYDGRPLFYRFALSEMTVPYADPRDPVSRKSAFDLGEYGAGETANNLQLGCDCLGVIHYMDGLSCSHGGEPLPRPNVICVHEQDNGILSKHTNFRTGRADVTRARELVFQLIVTVGNYEYILMVIFDNAANIHYEIRATGIISVTPTQPDVDTTTLKYGNVVAPGVFAPHHQHIFCLRVDPAIDGYRNSAIAYDEMLPMPRDENNPMGVGFESHTTHIEEESAFNLDWQTNRVVKMINPDKLNRFSKKPVAYKVVVPPTQLGLAHPTSMHNKRGEFVQNHIHVTKGRDDELYAAGLYPWQSRANQGGCKTWTERKQKLEGDGVLFLTLGFTHSTKSEDWPLMSAEVFRMHFKPVGFFEQSPALDVAPSTQLFNKSMKAFDKSGSSCCPAPRM